MRRLIHRFTQSQDRGSAAVQQEDGRFGHGHSVLRRNSARKDDKPRPLSSHDDVPALQEKLGLRTLEAQPRESKPAGDKVRALAARYENLGPNQGKGADEQRSEEANAPPSVQSSAIRHEGKTAPVTVPSQEDAGTEATLRAARPIREQHSPFLHSNDISSSSKAETGKGSPINGFPQRVQTRTPRSSDTSQQSDAMLSAVLHAGGGSDPSLRVVEQSSTASLDNEGGEVANKKGDPVPQLPSSLHTTRAETREVSGSSTGSHQQQKSVAFAPSPKKPTRPASPPAPPLPHHSSQDLFRSAPSLSTPAAGSFARPTVASTARKKGTSKSSTKPIAPAGSNRSKQSTAPGGRSLSTSGSASQAAAAAAKMQRSHSASTTARRGSMGSVQPPPADDSHSSLATRAAYASFDQSMPNSIPFVSSQVLRSASPMSVGTASTRSAAAAPLDVARLTRRASLTGGLYSSDSIGQGWASNGARGVGGPSWSEMTQEDLVNNLGARERTRQEVLWEIVASEERYVQELQKTKEFFIDALVGPTRADRDPVSPRSHALAALEGQADGSSAHVKKTRIRSRQGGTIAGSHDDDSPASPASGNLPIASHFMSASLDLQDGQSLREDGTSSAKYDPYQGGSGSSNPYAVGLGLVPVASRGSSRPGSYTGPHPVKKAHATTTDAHVIKSTSKGNTPKRWSTNRAQKKEGKGAISSSLSVNSITPDVVQLPPPLRMVLQALDNGIIEGHARLSETLKRRYEEQWPLVRSLADVFSSFAYVLQYYREYVVHLERALDCLDEAALMERAMRGKRLRKDRVSPTIALGRTIASLESAASERGECGLSIFLAMPFQRLLKYPLLFQNLLFHTDASTHEFENTVQMVVDVERIVRVIEDEKVSKEERDKTIDAFARIENIKDKLLLRPKADRLLVEERALYGEAPRRALSESEQGQQAEAPASALSTPMGTGVNALRASVKGRRSYRRLSDLLSASSSSSGVQGLNSGEDGRSSMSKAPNMGSKRDIWILRFSDVELRCQRIGVTALPMVSSTISDSTPATTTSVIGEGPMQPAAEDEAKIRDEFKRTRESKERLRALRNTTLRSKTRNLYKFICVTSWKSTRERPEGEGPTSADLMEGLVEEDEVEEDEDDDDSNDGSDGTEETDDGMLDSEPYIRQSKLSFSYTGHDRVEPKISSSLSQPNAPRRGVSGSAQSASVAATGSSTSLQRGRGQDIMRPQSAQKRHSLNSPITSTTGFSVSPSMPAHMSSSTSRFVMANSKTRADKFGTRMRQDLPLTPSSGEAYHHDPGESSYSLSPPQANVRGSEGVHNSHAMPSRVISTEPDLAESGKSETMSRRIADVEEHDGPVSAASMAVSSSSPRFPSFVRERSLDSNLRLLGGLVHDRQSKAEAGDAAETDDNGSDAFVDAEQ